MKNRRIVSVVIAAVMTLGMLYSVKLPVNAEELSLQDKFNSILNPDAPEGFNEDNSNPFGYEKGVPFRLYEESDLFMYQSGIDDYYGPEMIRLENYKTKENGSDLNISGGWTDTEVTKVKTDTNFGNTSESHWFIDSVPVNLGYCNSDNPRKTGIAFIGAKKDGDKFDVEVWVYNTLSKKFSNKESLGSMSFIKQEYGDKATEATMMYQMRNFLSITAGDFDKDGIDTIVAYAACDGNPLLSQIEVTCAKESDAPSLGAPSKANAMIHNKYKEYQSDFTGDTSIYGYKKLGCSLASGDVTGDKIDDLIAVTYTQVIENDNVTSYGDEIIEPQLSVNAGGDKKTDIISGNGIMSSYIGTEYATSSSGSNMERNTILTPTATIARTDVTGDYAVVIGGYSEKILRSGSATGTLSGIERSRSAANLFVYDYSKTDIGESMQLARAITGLDFGAALKGGDVAANAKTTLPKLPIAAVSIDGSGQRDRIFVGGVFYEINKGDQKPVYMVDALNKTYKCSDFTSNNYELREVYVDDFAVASLNKVGGNYESIIFSLVGITYDSGGTFANSRFGYYYRLGIAGPAVNSETARVTGYYGTTFDVMKGQTVQYEMSSDQYYSMLNGSQFYNLGDGNDCANLVLCPVNYKDNDSIARYNSKCYNYADPQILAVLQASPYFKQLDQKSGGTKYSFTNKFSYSDEDSKVSSFSIGVDLESSSPFHKAALKVGYKGETKTWTEKEMEKEVTLSWDAEHDTVIVYRTPLISYFYDVYDPTKGEWKNGALCLTVVRSGEYQPLSVDEYNSFVDQYNEQGKKNYKERGKNPDDFPVLGKLGDGIYLGCEGDPTKYYEGTSTAPKGYQVIDDEVHTLNYDGVKASTDLISGEKVTTGEEGSHGVSVEYEAMAGPEIFRVGIQGSYENMSGHATSQTNASSTGIETSVCGIDEPELMEKGLFTSAQIRAHAFSWRPAQWDSGISYTFVSKEDNQTKITRKVPLYGYTLSNVTQAVDISKASMTLSASSFTYDGTAKVPNVTLTLDGKVLPADNHYSLSYEMNGKTVDKCINPGVYKVVAKGIKATIGGKEAQFEIKKASYTNPPAITKNYLYLRDNTESFTLTGLPADYGTVTWKAPTTAGSLGYAEGPTVSNTGELKYTVKSGAKGSSGKISVVAETQNYNDITFTVDISLVDQSHVKPKTGSSVSLQNSTLTYGQKLSELQFNPAEFVSDDGNANEVAGLLVWKKPDSVPGVGTTSAEWEFIPNDLSYTTYEGTVAITVNKADIDADKIIAPTKIDNLQYTGEAQALVNAGSVTGGVGVMKYYCAKVEDPGNPPTAPTVESAYTTSIPTATDPGTYRVWYWVTGDKNHKDISADPGKTIQVEITEKKKTKISIANAEVTGVTDKTYNGKAQTQNPVVTLAGKKLAAGTDYTITYTNNVQVGTATMTITGTGDYEGTKTVTFKILSAAQAKNLKNAMVTGLVDKPYTGKAITQSFTVTLGGKKLKKNTDYTVSYKNNTNVGNATITIKAKGKTYKGSKNVTFKINKATNPLKISGKTITFKEKELKKDKTLTVAQAYKISKAGVGTTTFKRANVDPAANKSSFTVDGKGNIKIKKGLKKGTYKVTVKVTAKGDKNYKSGSKTATVTIKIK